MIGLDSHPSRREGILTQRASDTQLLLDLGSGEYYALDDVGTRVWELCDGARRVADIVAVISQEYDAPAAVIQADVLELLDELAHEKLVVESR